MVDAKVVDQFGQQRLLACISSRPGQSGRADGYILEGKELEFYQKKMVARKKWSLCLNWTSSIPYYLLLQYYKTANLIIFMFEGSKPPPKRKSQDRPSVSISPEAERQQLI